MTSFGVELTARSLGAEYFSGGPLRPRQAETGFAQRRLVSQDCAHHHLSLVVAAGRDFRCGLRRSSSVTVERDRADDHPRP